MDSSRFYILCFFLTVIRSFEHSALGLKLNSLKELTKAKETLNLSPNYDNRNREAYIGQLLQGICKVKCFNQSPAIPKLDEENEIFTTEASCETISCRHCIQCTIGEGEATVCQKWLEPHCYNKSELESKIKERLRLPGSLMPDFTTLPSTPTPHPIFHCSSFHKNSSSFNAYFRLEYPDHNATLSNLTRMAPENIPRLFVVETLLEGFESSSQEAIYLTSSWLISVKVPANTSFQVRVTPLSPKLIHPSTETQPITIFDTFDRGSRHHPKDVKIQRIRQNPSVTSHPDLQVLLHWKSGMGTQATCSSRIWILDTDADSFDFAQANKSFWFYLTNETKQGSPLYFETNQIIQIMEMSDLDPDSVSNATGFTIRLPPCLEFFNHNFTMCPPPPPQHLDFQILPNNSVLTTWNPPLHTLENNSIDAYEIRLIKVSPHYTSKGVSIPATTIPHLTLLANITIPGNMTSFLFTNFSHNGVVQVMIKAITKGGASIFVSKGPNPPIDISDSVLQKLLIAGIVIVAIIAIGCFGCLIKIRRDKRNRHEVRAKYCGDDKNESCKIESVYFPPYCSKWLIDTNCLKIGELIGEGNFGKVHAATLYKLDSSRIVAVKTLKESVNISEQSKFWEEFQILKNLEPHRHVVRLIGIVKANHPTIVVEYCDGGDLHSYLRKLRDEKARQIARDKRRFKWMNSGTISGEFLRNSTGSNVSIGSTTLAKPEEAVELSMVTNEAYFSKFKDDDHTEVKETVDLFELSLAATFGRQVAEGMEFLSNNKIVHRDLAARNILVIHEQRPILKIADFGLSRDVYEKNWYKKNSDDKIPFKWLALECLLDEVYTTKSDVWSYGILLWEIVTYGGSPYPGIKNMDIFEFLRKGYRMSQPENCPRQLYTIMRKCWEKESEDRPDFGAIRRMLDRMLEKSQPIEYFQLQENEFQGVNDEKEEVHYEQGLVFLNEEPHGLYEIPNRPKSNVEQNSYYSVLASASLSSSSPAESSMIGPITESEKSPTFHNPILKYSENVLYTSLDPSIPIASDHEQSGKSFSASIFEIQIPYNNGTEERNYENESCRININEKQHGSPSFVQGSALDVFEIQTREERPILESTASAYDPQSLSTAGEKSMIRAPKFFNRNSLSFQLITGKKWKRSGGTKKNNKYPASALV